MEKIITPDSLLKEAANVNEAYHIYLLKKNGKTLFCFTEGKHDSDYYMDKVRCFYGDDFIILDCKGKGKVVEMYNKIFPNDKDKEKLAFFVDKDFDLPLKNSDIFETDYYSIENYYCTPSAFERILLYGMKIKKQEEIDNLMKFYIDEFDKFHRTVDLFNAFYSILHQYERRTGQEFKLNLGEKFDKTLASVSVDNFMKNYTLATLLTKYSIPTDAMTNEEVDSERIRLLHLGPFITFRGKYEIEFLWKILNYLVSDGNHEKKNVKKKISLSLNEVTFMSDFSQYADIPNSLRDYIAKFKSS